MNQRRCKLEEYGDILTTTDLQEYLGLSKESVLKMIHSENFPKIRVKNGRKYLFVKSALKEYLHNKAIGA